MLFALALLVTSASVDPLAEKIARGNAAMESLEFEEAADLFMSVAVDESATEEQRLEANLLAGTAHRILGRDNEARLCFRYVLLKRPETRMNPSKSPKVVQFFELVRQELIAEGRASTTPPASQSSPAATSTAPLTTSQPLVGETSIAPMIVFAAGAAAVVVGAGAATFIESSLGERQTATAQDQLLLAGRTSVVVAAVGAVVMTGGAIMWGLQ